MQSVNNVTFIIFLYKVFNNILRNEAGVGNVALFVRYAGNAFINKGFNINEIFDNFAYDDSC